MGPTHSKNPPMGIIPEIAMLKAWPPPSASLGEPSVKGPTKRAGIVPGPKQEKLCGWKAHSLMYASQLSAASWKTPGSIPPP